MGQGLGRIAHMDHWLLWWQVDPAALETQATGYAALAFRRTARAGAVFCLVLSAALTTAMVSLKLVGSDALYEVALLLFLAAAIVFGQRWAMIGAMLGWTGEKTVDAAESLAQGDGAAFVSQVLWWCVYMHAFWFAFRVEQALRRRPAANAL